jgi:ribonuclease R
MADKIGARFAARVSGVARFGLFVTLHGTGANGLIPLSSLPDDYWMHDETTQSLHGRRTRQSFRLAQEVTVRLREASPITGGLVFDLIDLSEPGLNAAPKGPHRAAPRGGGKPGSGRKRGRK